MSEIYVYDKVCEDFGSFGLVGALTPISCEFEEGANDTSVVRMVHPLDKLGRYTNLQKGNILKMPVPVRATPEIQDGEIVTSVEIWTVKPTETLTKAQRALYKKAEGNARMRYLSGGTQVVVTRKPPEGRYKVKTKYGNGYMDPEALDYVTAEILPDNSNNIESVLSGWTVKDQLFRIYEIMPAINAITVYARHISYDLLYNVTSYKKNGTVDAGTALAMLLQNCIKPHDFAGYTNIADSRTGINWVRTGAIEALLNPEDGMTTKWNCALIRDNFDLYILRDPGQNRGVTVEYAKNLLAISGNDSDENVITGVIPIGKTKDGKDLLLTDDGSGDLIESQLAGNYPVPHIHVLECENCTVGEDGVTTSIARARMREQAEALFASGADKPEIAMRIKLVLLGDSAQYAQYKALDRLFLWDYVTIRHKLLGIDVTARVVKIVWDVLRGRMINLELGSMGKTLANTGITRWQVPQGFSGTKIAAETVSGSALKDAIIAARHVQAESINTGSLQAGSVTAEKIAAMAIVAEKIAAGAITADKLDAATVNAHIISAMAATIGSLTADDITTDTLAAALANFVVLSAGNAEFELATITNLLANALILQQGVAASMQITNLAVTSANLLNATIGKLILKGADGNYYAVAVGADGSITTEAVTLTDAEIAAGAASGGQQIVETTVNADSINGQNIRGQEAVINTILTTALTAGKITANEALISSATIPALYTTAVEALGNSMTFRANNTIQLLLGANDTVQKWFTFDNERGLITQKPAYTDADGTQHPASIWYTRTDNTGYHVHRTDKATPVGSFSGEGITTGGLTIGDMTLVPDGENGVVWMHND